MGGRELNFLGTPGRKINFFSIVHHFGVNALECAKDMKYVAKHK